jgi:hypothetical protein
MKKKRKRNAPEQTEKKARNADMTLKKGMSLEEVLKVLEISEANFARWRIHQGGTKCEEAKTTVRVECSHS